MDRLFTHIEFTRVHPLEAKHVTLGRAYRVVGVDEGGIACIIDDNGNLLPLDDGYGCRFAPYKPVEVTDG